VDGGLALILFQEYFYEQIQQMKIMQNKIIKKSKKKINPQASVHPWRVCPYGEHLIPDILEGLQALAGLKVTGFLRYIKTVRPLQGNHNAEAVVTMQEPRLLI
jgi:hypothetical protein